MNKIKMLREENLARLFRSATFTTFKVFSYYYLIRLQRVRGYLHNSCCTATFKVALSGFDELSKFLTGNLDKLKSTNPSRLPSSLYLYLYTTRGMNSEVNANTKAFTIVEN